MRQGYGPGPEVGHALPAAGPAEVQHLPVRAGSTHSSVSAACSLRRSRAPAGIELRVEAGVVAPAPARDADRTRRAAAGAQPPAPKPKDGPSAVQGSGTRHPSRPFSAPLGPPERRVLRRSPGRSRDLVQAELLALVEVGRPGQRQHQQGRGPGPAQPEIAIELGVGAVAEQPGAGRPAGASRRSWAAARSGWRAGRRRGWTAPRSRTLPTRCAAARLSVMTRRNSPASQSASSRSKLKAWPEPVRAGVPRRGGTACTHASATADPRRVVLVEDLRATRRRSRGPRRGPRAGAVPSAAEPSPSVGLRRGSGSERSLARPWATSTRKPSTPRSDQNRSVVRKSSRTSRLSQLRSGCSAANRCRYHCPSGDRRPGRAAEQRVPVRRAAATRPGPCRRGRCSGPGPATRRRRPAPPGTRRAGSRCGSGTMSTMTLMPAACSAATISSKSARVPSRGSTSR